jgi:hypothetical protein
MSSGSPKVAIIHQIMSNRDFCNIFYLLSFLIIPVESVRSLAVLFPGCDVFMLRLSPLGISTPHLQLLSRLRSH